MIEETVDPQETVEAPVQQEEQVHEDQVEAQPEPKDTHVPLAALQKERKRRQELEYENQLLKDQYLKPAPPVDDDSKYEPVTKGDLGQHSSEIMRAVEEKYWVKNNPEKAQRVNEHLEEFLKQKPHLAQALKAAPNRYEEAWELMNALTPKQQAQLKPQPQKREAPGSPSSIPKAAAMNQAIDLMSMSDSEYLAWRKTQKKRR